MQGGREQVRRREELFGRELVSFSSADAEGEEDGAGETDVFLQAEDGRTEEERQDAHLDVISQTLSRVGEMAQGFQNELRAQNE